MPLLLLAVLIQQPPGGVSVDPDGVLKYRAVDTAARLKTLREAARREKGGLVYVSLPRLFAEARKCDGKLPDDLRTLSGLTKLKAVFIHEGDLVIAGEAEAADPDFPGRPVGKRTGRPLLQFDDLVTALRVAGPGRDGSPFGCSIDLTEEGAARMASKSAELKDVIASQPRKRRESYDAVAAAGGLQPVRFFGLPPDSRAAFACLEADYLLKRHSLELDPTPVKQAPSLLDLVTRQTSARDRLWFEAAYAPVSVSAGGCAFEIAGPSLAVRARGVKDEEPDPAVRAYAERLSKHMAELCRKIPAWADLANFADMALVAALIRTDALHTKVGWEIPDLFAAKVPVARSVDTLVNFREAGSILVVISGGVSLSLDEAARNRQAAAPAIAPRRPGGWSLVEPRK